MQHNFLTDFYRFLWACETEYYNRYISFYNNFNKFRFHTFEDFVKLYQVENDYRSFMSFSRDIERFIRLYEIDK